MPNPSSKSKLANGRVDANISFTSPETLLEFLKWRARTYRTGMGMDQPEIEQNLLLENALQIDSIQLNPNVISGLAMGASLLPKRNLSASGKKNSSLNYSEALTELRNQPRHVIDGLLPESTVSLLAGDSGIGKSPLLVQMGVTVAAGVEFLGQSTSPGPTLLVDYENGWPVLTEFTRQISNFLGLPSPPPNFHIFHQPEDPGAVEREILLLKPRLVMIDAVRGYDPSLEEKNTSSGERLNNLLRLAERTSASIVLLHHLRKPDPKFPPPKLESAPVMDWLRQVSGPRALVNQTATRIGVEAYRGTKLADIVLRGHFKGIGEFGPWYVQREFDEIGSPRGYSRLTGLSLVPNVDLFAALPVEFGFREARLMLKKGGSSTANWLSKLRDAGVLRKEGERYVKVKMETKTPSGLRSD